MRRVWRNGFALLSNIKQRYAGSKLIRAFLKKYDVARHEREFDVLYHDINGFQVSKAARSTQDSLEYTYGEIEFRSFIALMAWIRPQNETIFYDLGSGVGKAVIAAAMVFDWQAYHGIECFQPLVEIALSQKARLKTQPSYFEKASRIYFHHGDFFLENFSHATLVFIGGTVFFGERWKLVNECLLALADGVFVVSISKAPTVGFSIVHRTMMQVSWGVVPVFISLRVSKLKNMAT